jgi:two-component system, NarL family, invasion response regulator UvrY
VIRVLLADDHPVVRAGLRQILAEAPDITVVGEAADGSAVVEQAAGTRPDVVLLDVTMPGTGFITLVRNLRRHHPHMALLVLSVHPEDQYAVRAFRAGASGYLSKERSPELLLAAIRKVAAGGRYVPDSVVDRLVTRLDRESAGELHESLSDREYEVLCLLGGGRTVSDVAAELQLSPKTVSTFRTRILRKMRLRSNAELIRYTLEHELT